MKICKNAGCARFSLSRSHYIYDNITCDGHNCPVYLILLAVLGVDKAEGLAIAAVGDKLCSSIDHAICKQGGGGGGQGPKPDRHVLHI